MSSHFKKMILLVQQNFLFRRVFIECWFALFAERFNVGQNLALFFTNGPFFPEPETRVQAWYDEISLYSYSPGPFKFSTETGHFTQIVWGSTNRLGCARSRYVANGFPHQLLVCNYGPGGNVQGRPLYTAGQPCSQCSCSARYPGLCAVGTKLNTESPFSFADFFPSYSPFFFSTTTNAPAFFTNSVYSTTPNTIYYTNPPATKKPIIQSRTYTQATTDSPSYITYKTTRPAYYTTNPTTRRPVGATKKYTNPTTKRPTYAPATYRTTKIAKKPTTAVARRTTVTAPPQTTPPTFAAPSCPLPSTTGPACGANKPAPLPLSASDKAALLRVHNKWRAELARGGVAGFPSAANMRQMVSCFTVQRTR